MNRPHANPDPAAQTGDFVEQTGPFAGAGPLGAPTGAWRAETDAPPGSPADATVDAPERTPEQDAADAAKLGIGPGSLLVGRYQLGSVIASGGQGVVFEARDTEFDRPVAVKVVLGRSALLDSADAGTFRAEYRTLGRLNDRRIAAGYDAGRTAEGRPFFVMELVRGEDIARHCHLKRLGLRDRLALVAEVCEALHGAHLKKVVHRDVKSVNILVAEADGAAVPKVIDFGIAVADAEAGRDSRPAGTLPYMSPEQAFGEPEGNEAVTDVWAIGVVLYELLTWTLPHDPHLNAKEFWTERERLRREVVVPPSARVSARKKGPVPAAALRGEVDAVVMKALAPEAKRRYASAAEFAADLRAYLAGDPVSAVPQTRRYVYGKWLRKNAVFVTLAAAAVIGPSVGMAVALVQRNEAVRQKEVAVRATKLTRRSHDNADGLLRSLVRVETKLTEQDRDTIRRGAADIDALFAEAPGVEGRAFAADNRLRYATQLSLLYPEKKDESADAYRDAVGRYESLAKEESGELNYRWNAGRARFDLGRLDQRDGGKDAEAHYRAAVGHFEAVVEKDPADRVYRRDLADALNNLATVRRDAKAFTEARDFAKRAVELSEALNAEEPDNYVHRYFLATARFNLANLSRDLGDPASAVGGYGKSLEFWASAKEQTPDVRRYRGYCHWERAHARSLMGKHADAVADWKAAIGFAPDDATRDALQRFLAAEEREVRLAADDVTPQFFAESVVTNAAAAAAAGVVGETALQDRLAARARELRGELVAAKPPPALVSAVDSHPAMKALAGPKKNP